jgi:uncharacterized protein YggE
MVRYAVFLTPLFGLAIAATPVQAEEMPRAVSVTGEATIVVVPDAAEISAGVVSVGTTAAEALADNSKRMQAVFEGLKALGVADREMRTSNFSISPVYQRQQRDANEPPAITGYRVSNMVYVRLRDVADTGRVIDRLVTLGANNIANVQFVVSDRQERLQAALGEAVKNARARAELMAGAAGARVGPVLSLNEGGGPTPRPVFAMKAMAESAAPPIAGGEETLQISVQATFALE